MKVFLTGGSGFIGKALIDYLIGTHGDTVVALCRSSEAEKAVLGVASQAAYGRGAKASDHCTVVRGDLDSVETMSSGMANCDVVCHLAAWVKLTGSWNDCQRVTVQGTANTLRAAKAAKVPTFLQVSSYTVLIKDKPEEMKDASEATPKLVPEWAFYARAKAMAEDLALQAADEYLRVVTVRPAIVWGPGDTSVIPVLRDSIKIGSFRWLKPNNQESVTTFIDNVCYGLRLAAVKGKSGQVYHMQDKESPMTVREFFTKYAAAALPNLQIPTAEVSGKALWAVATVLENIPVVSHFSKRYISRQMLVCLAHSITFRSTNAESELGYRPPVSFDEGLARTQAWTNQLMTST
eukprot:TRINITY_DN5976_c0_g1_i1.p1 TRINITY_DN5976_c0_g1~~TRINITY_DN5976_c0_g1_i1.p1  ORF type:complete len:350 (+),score=56.06 TRINITY_DN5976_c0_g1_i1:211-1260(+)